MLAPAGGSGRAESCEFITSHSKVTRMSTSPKPCFSAVWMVAGSSARDRKYRPRIRLPRLHSSICAACSCFSVSPQTRAMRQRKNSVSQGSNSQGTGLGAFMSCLVTRGDFLTDSVSWAFHHAEMHPGQILPNDAQGQQLSSRKNDNDRSQKSESLHGGAAGLQKSSNDEHQNSSTKGGAGKTHEVGQLQG